MALFVDIEKKLGNFHLKVKFEADNNILAILGASGCGKSMTLKCIAGIEKPDKGKIILDGVALFDSEKRINLIPQKRKVGYLFQNYALFPDMTVEQNIACGVKDKTKKDLIVNEFIQTMNLKGTEKKKPHQLSGGQQQRVALARILANEPEVLLLDEPFSALDSYLRIHLEREVHDILKKFGKTVVLVSHDRDEVFRLSNTIATMKDGMIETIGEKKEVFSHPKTRSGAILTGCQNISHVQIINNEYIYAVEWNLKIHVPNMKSSINYVGIRTYDIQIDDENGENMIMCDVIEEIENPFFYTIMLSPVSSNTKARITIQVDKNIWQKKRKERLTISIPSKDILLLED